MMVLEGSAVAVNWKKNSGNEKVIDSYWNVRQRPVPDSYSAKLEAVGGFENTWTHAETAVLPASWQESFQWETRNQDCGLSAAVFSLAGC